MSRPIVIHEYNQAAQPAKPEHTETASTTPPEKNYTICGSRTHQDDY